MERINDNNHLFSYPSRTRFLRNPLEVLKELAHEIAYQLLYIKFLLNIVIDIGPNTHTRVRITMDTSVILLLLLKNKYYNVLQACFSYGQQAYHF